MSDLNLYSINWQDGMLISQQHLRDQEKYIDELARWHAMAVGDQYGLVRKSVSGKPALTITPSMSGNRLTVEVTRCQAILPDGLYIEIGESAGTQVRAEAAVTEGKVPIYVGVDVSTKVQLGDPDPSEEVPRVPYLTHKYVLSIGEKPALPEGHYIQIAMLDYAAGELKPNANYYPPCLTLFADERLNQKVSDYKSRLEKLISLSSQAYMSVAADTELATQKTALQAAFKSTIGRFVHHLASSHDQLIAGRNSGHPITLVIFFKRLFRVFSTLLNLHPDLRDYLNERYFMKETSSEIGRFLASIDNYLMASYDHTNLGSHMAAIDSLFEDLRKILGFFAQVKKDQLGHQAVATESMTYRGITYRLADYTSTRLERAGELGYLMVEIADPAPMSDLVILLAKDLVGEERWANMQVRLGLNEARGLGETDPVPVDLTTFQNKVALKSQDMVKTSKVRQITLVLRGAGDAAAFESLSKSDLIVYSM